MSGPFVVWGAIDPQAFEPNSHDKRITRFPGKGAEWKQQSYVEFTAPLDPNVIPDALPPAEDARKKPCRVSGMRL